jgi:hypothetical protein
VYVAFECDRARLVRYAEAAGVPFVPAPAWRWTAAAPERYATAPDWLAPQVASTAAGRSLRTAWFRPALVLATAALVLHVGATLVQWAALHWGTWRAGREIVALAQSAGLVDATTPGAAAGRIGASLHRCASPRGACGTRRMRCRCSRRRRRVSRGCPPVR